MSPTPFHSGSEPEDFHGDEEFRVDEQGDESDEDVQSDEADMAVVMEESRRSTYNDGSASVSASYVPVAFDDVHQTPRALSSPMTGRLRGYSNLYGLDQEKEESSMGIDPQDYNVVPSHNYQPGSIFAMLWSEPRPSHMSQTLPAGRTSQGNFNVGIRRFVVIATDRSHHSTCVPILTYQHLACAMSGVNPITHGIIYSQDCQPEKAPDERELGYPPISCTMNPSQAAFAKTSRVNYSKLVTIEHTARVQFIGSVSESDFATVQHAVDDCWRKKNRHSTRDAKSKPSKPSKLSKTKSSRQNESSHKLAEQPGTKSRSSDGIPSRSKQEAGGQVHTEPKSSATDESPKLRPTTSHKSNSGSVVAKLEDENQEQKPGNLSYPVPDRYFDVEEVWYYCKIPQIVAQMREVPGEEDSSAFDLLANLVVINGSAKGFECTTCSSYLTKRWGKVGLPVLTLLSNCIDRWLLFGKQQQVLNPLPVLISVERKFIRVSAKNSKATIPGEVAEALNWLCTAIHHDVDLENNDSPTKSAYLSIIEGRFDSIEKILRQSVKHIAVNQQEIQDPGSNCWLSLFKSVVISWQKDEDTFHEEKLPGLEIPFDMMLHLASIQNFHSVDDGIILLGFFTALVPIRVHPDSNTIQWHFESVDDDNFIMPSQLKSIQGNWYKTTNSSELAGFKCVVGWFEQANVMLGTSSLVTANEFTWSCGLTSHHQTAHREGFEGGGQISFGLGPFTFAPQGVRTYKYRSNTQRYSAPVEYDKAIRLSAKKVATVIDTGSKQAWLIPMLSLVLHLCHRYFQEFRLPEEMSDPIPFADPSPDGGSAAIRALQDKGDIAVLGGTLSQLILCINTNLLDSSRTREPPKGRFIYASELMDAVVEPTRGSSLKKLTASEDAISWRDLAGESDFIGVCSGIGDVIEPMAGPGTPANPTCGCFRLPQNLYLLAAHMKCLERLSTKAGDSIDNLPTSCCMLGENVFWARNGEPLWLNCSAPNHQPPWSTRDIVQQISRKGKNKAPNSSMTATAMAKTGVVVFGTRPVNLLKKRF